MTSDQKRGVIVLTIISLGSAAMVIAFVLMLKEWLNK
jgi:hypothetical protein